jgi:hypothetical protein
MAARMPMIATTIISSMSVKPFISFFMVGAPTVLARLPGDEEHVSKGLASRKENFQAV